MFNLPVDSRLTEWLNHRQHLEETENPLQEVWDFWSHAPYIPYNRNIDPYYQKSWPTPWEIIDHNKYDDFTKSLMIAWTLKLTKKFNNSVIEVKSLIDESNNRAYNLVFIDNNWVINYNDNGPVSVDSVPDSFRLENIVEVKAPR